MPDVQLGLRHQGELNFNNYASLQIVGAQTEATSLEEDVQQDKFKPNWG